jgi:polyhydroxybutyrate depolymerase
MHRALAVAVLALVSFVGASSAVGATAPPSGAAAASPSAEPTCVPTLAPGNHSLDLDINGTPREVIVQVPAVETGARPPAVIAFHGYTSHAWQIEATSGLSGRADELGFVAAYPEALGDPTEWAYASTARGDDRDMALTEALMTTLVEQACVEPERLVLAGHSMGGGMASDAACRLAERVAGVVVLAALWLDPPCAPGRPVPVVAAHALDDPLLPYDGGPLGFGSTQLAAEDAVGAWATLDGCGATPLTSESADGAAILTWPDCAAPVVLHRLSSGGHDWPAIGSDLIVDMVMASG